MTTGTQKEVGMNGQEIPGWLDTLFGVIGYVVVIGAIGTLSALLILLLVAP